MFRIKLLKQVLGFCLCMAFCMAVTSLIRPEKDVTQQRAYRSDDTIWDTLPRRPVVQFKQSQESMRRGKINVRELCKGESLEEENTFEYGRLMANRSVYYCYVPKCGTTFMELFLQKVFQSGSPVYSRDYYEEIKERHVLEDAFSFTFVREPYSRLFSAYENKFFHPNEMWKKLGTDVIREVRPDPSPLSKTIGHDVTFVELVQYVVTLWEQGRPLNPHLAPMKSICDPCRKRFDFIGKLETMSTDLEELVEEWKYREIVSKDIDPTAKIEYETKYSRSFGRIYHMFGSLNKYKNLLSRYKLFQRTWSSYQMRGVILKEYEMPFLEMDVNEVDEPMYRTAIKDAIDSSEKYEAELKAQRTEALVQAYRTVPLDLMYRLQEFVKTDCLLFGYDDKPRQLFDRSFSINTQGHDYFKGL
ncbi:carbohydrate sulfotransferase 8-like [Mercenaria mercenaria]|uniref:carbohydrate sulfotransferase 8-like n=1 Tax=Mercenaria mercenaria TaxID=6596 RepID=UPI00234EB88A|nr:carbohydrate sulfotransferase 8-like [Mercenaria mercenaria]